MRVLHPKEWKPPIGYANGIETSGKLVFVAGQVGWNPEQVFETMIFVSDLLDHPGKIELEATAVIPPET